MMIVAGVVFLSVMDGITLFMRFSQDKARQITGNMRIYEGYYNLEYLISAADSISSGDGFVRIYREGGILADLIAADSVLMARMGSVSDTLMWGVAVFEAAGAWELFGTDTIKVIVREPDGSNFKLVFPIKPSLQDLAVKNLQEQETQYAYE